MSDQITVQATIGASKDKVWMMYTDPEFVKQWNNASPDWHTPRAENNLTPGGKFLYRMEAKDGSEGFDFTGTYDEVEPQQLLAYTMSDGRKARVTFNGDENQTTVTVAFDPEEENSIEIQQAGWQAILNNFKHIAESSL